MWSDNSTSYGLGSNRHCMCHTAMVPCSSTNPMTQWYNNVPLSSTSFLNYQTAPENTMCGFSHASNPANPLFLDENDQEAGEHMSTDEIDSWLLPNPYTNPTDEPLNRTICCSWTGSQDHGQFNNMQTQDTQVNYDQNCGQSSRERLIEQQLEHTLNFPHGIDQNDYSTSALFYAILPPTTGMNLAQEWALNKSSFSPLHPEILLDQTVGRHSNSTRTSSLGTRQQASEFPPVSRQEKILRYLEKKKTRKYKKKIIYSSRKEFARTRPRIRGRFVRRSETNVE
ncbi:putative transcription factor C2C2-CO-like family [Helianthus annuus]|uniref:Putative CCT domain-containing protein n=1 Tax=Helianthus annuus TaxID=4232 RepID=A0A251U8H4_HELAN|nr:putative transcription factor C2C2-CO-like family [Helianthus annuus]KAJ0903021.1 putative transcription factor C2C2-CO-like family [Helianthus annuus]